MGRIEQFYPDAWAAGVHSSIVPSAPAGLFFIGDTYGGVKLPDRGEAGDMNNFGPRVGIAWDPTGSGKMSIRAGGGLFYSSRLSGLFLNDAAISSPFSLRIDLIDSTHRRLRRLVSSSILWGLIPRAPIIQASRTDSRSASARERSQERDLCGQPNRLRLAAGRKVDHA